MDSYTKWEFPVPFHEIFCSVQVYYIDFEDYTGSYITSSKTCSFSGAALNTYKLPVASYRLNIYCLAKSINRNAKYIQLNALLPLYSSSNFNYFDQQSNK